MRFFYPNANGTLNRADWTDIRNYESFGMPILYLTGSIAGMTKDNEVPLNYLYGDRAGSLTAKWQGASSVTLPGRYKNLTIKFDNAFEVVSGWGVQKKYVLKANFVDPSHARNIVSAKLWGQMVKSRAASNEKLNALPNGGAVDGFPIIVSLNGKFHGLYTWNIPKDAWMLGMTETGHQFIVSAEHNNNGAAAFNGLATFEADSNGEVDFEVEYSSDGQTDWVLESVNQLLAAVKDSDGTNIEYGITPYIDWDSAIDYYILSVLIANYDGQFRNYLLYSYDGTKIGISAYDMDVVYGNRATGKYFHAADVSAPTFESFANNHKLFYLIWTYMRPQLRNRFNELVGGILSESNVATEFTNFVHGIPLPVYVDNERLWPQIPSGASTNLWQIINFYRLRLALAMEWIKDTTGEKSLPTQVNPNPPTNTYTNKVPLSVGTDGNVYNSSGWKGQYRLSSSSGSERAQDNNGITGFIPVQSGDTVRFTDSGAEQRLLWNEEGMVEGNCSIVYYNSSFTWLGSVTLQPAYYGICGTDSTGISGVDAVGTTDNGGIVTFTVPNNSNIAYVRLSMSCVSANGSDLANLIVTVNEEIR